MQLHKPPHMSNAILKGSPYQIKSNYINLLEAVRLRLGKRSHDTFAVLLAVLLTFVYESPRYQSYRASGLKIAHLSF